MQTPLRMTATVLGGHSRDVTGGYLAMLGEEKGILWAGFTGGRGVTERRGQGLTGGHRTGAHHQAALVTFCERGGPSPQTPGEEFSPCPALGMAMEAPARWGGGIAVLRRGPAAWAGPAEGLGGAVWL